MARKTASALMDMLGAVVDGPHLSRQHIEPDGLSCVALALGLLGTG